MKLQTIVDKPVSDWKIVPQSNILVLGSCFAERVGDHLATSGLSCVVNPFGVLYNPASIARIIDIAARGEYSPSIIFDERRGVWFDYNTDTELESPSEEKCRAIVRDAFGILSSQFAKADVVIVTFGTNHVYLNEGTVVSNCHKQPSGSFSEKLLDVSEIERLWNGIVSSNPSKKFIFTVSPIRYRKYGFHESQLSKATLLLAADAVVGRNSNCSYFPAYEIMNDELRDYRFYAEDMIHPSEQAVRYIIDCFIESFFENSTKEFAKDYSEVRKALEHRPLHPENEAYKHFLTQLLLKIDRLCVKYPYFAFNKEKNICHTLLNKLQNGWEPKE